MAVQGDHMKPTISTASKNNIIVKTGFKHYDVCANPYVGCSFGCSYCYVRFFIKDPNHDWGEFVRIRKHAESKIQREIKKLRDQGSKVRIVIGTMTDPYQPVERKERITRSILKIIAKNTDVFTKVGIFTRSPISVEDIEIIKQLPNPIIHHTISPYDDKYIRLLEPIGIKNERRFKTMQEFKNNGIRIEANIAPTIPYLSEDVIESISQKVAEIKTDQFFIDPMQAYDQSYKKLKESLHGQLKADIAEIMEDKEKYQEWKEQHMEKWKNMWQKVGSKNTLPVWSDHENKVYKHLITGKDVDYS